VVAWAISSAPLRVSSGISNSGYIIQYTPVGASEIAMIPRNESCHINQPQPVVILATLVTLYTCHLTMFDSFWGRVLGPCGLPRLLTVLGCADVAEGFAYQGIDYLLGTYATIVPFSLPFLGQASKTTCSPSSSNSQTACAGTSTSNL